MEFNRLNIQKSLLATAFAGTLSLGVLATATAAVITPTSGPVIIKYDGGTTENVGAGTCTTYSLAGVPSGCAETTWGVGNVTTIQKNDGSGTNLFVDNVGARIFFMIYGIADAKIEANGPNFNIYNVGCDTGDPECDGKIHIDFYSVPTGTLAPYTLAETNRIDLNEFTGITDIGTPIMKWTMDTGAPNAAPSADLLPYDELLTQLFQTVSATSLPATGSGEFYASCVLFGGTDECAQYNTNSFITGSGVLADFFGGFHLRLQTAFDPHHEDWEGVIFDPVITNAIPEPTTLALLGLGMLGAGLLRRRKAVK
jgi:PEP-CTERM motif